MQTITFEISDKRCDRWEYFLRNHLGEEISSKIPAGDLEYLAYLTLCHIVAAQAEKESDEAERVMNAES